MWIGDSYCYMALVRLEVELSTSELPLAWMGVVLIGGCSFSAYGLVPKSRNSRSVN